MPLHNFVHFEAVDGKEDWLRKELTRILEPTRAEPGCIRINLYESLRSSRVFAIYSEWVDDAAFDTHAQLPHMKRFLDLASRILTHPVQALRTKQIG